MPNKIKFLLSVFFLFLARAADLTVGSIIVIVLAIFSPLVDIFLMLKANDEYFGERYVELKQELWK